MACPPKRIVAYSSLFVLRYVVQDFVSHSPMMTSTHTVRTSSRLEEKDSEAAERSSFFGKAPPVLGGRKVEKECRDALDKIRQSIKTCSCLCYQCGAHNIYLLHSTGH